MTSFSHAPVSFLPNFNRFCEKSQVVGRKFLPKHSIFREKENIHGRKISRCKSAGYPPARFSGHDTLCRAAASCSGPRTVSGHRGVEQCDPQLWPWYIVPASSTPHTAGGSEETLCLLSANGCHSRALRQAVLSPGGEACVSHKTLFPAQSVPDSRGVHKEFLVSSA